MPKTAAFTALAMLAFAANSVLCRMALGNAAIDAASFASVRLASGAVTLVALSAATGRGSIWRAGNWSTAGWLFLYAVPFSFAYLELGAGTGALILFGSVQVTMLVAALVAGERPHAWQWAGLLLAVGGLCYLVLPGLTSPSPTGSALMTLAGVAWGFYTLRGRGEGDPVTRTASNFVRAAPMAVLVSLLTLGDLQFDVSGVGLAVASGALASGIGYVVWYAALTGLTTTRAAAVQLSVPVLAAAGGVLFLSEPVTVRLLVASVLVLGGVALALFVRRD